MATLSVSVPEELKEKMNHLDVVNWSAVARHAFEEKVQEVEFLQKIAKKSRLTEKDAKAIGDKMSMSMSKRLKQCK